MASMGSTSSSDVPAGADITTDNSLCEVSIIRNGADELRISISTPQIFSSNSPEYRGKVAVVVGFQLPALAEINLYGGPQVGYQGSVLNICFRYDRVADPDYMEAIQHLLGLGELYPLLTQHLGLRLFYQRSPKVSCEFVDGVVNRYAAWIAEPTTV